MPIILFFALTAASLQSAEPVRIVVLGDSITKGVRSGVKAEETYAARLADTLRQQGLIVEVFNAGVGGETTSGGLKRLDKAVLERRPHIVTIMYGTNDSHVDAGAKAERVSAADFESHLSQLVDRITASGAMPILMTEPGYAENGPKNGLGEDCNVRLGRFMEVCRSVAIAKKTPVVDHFSHWMAVRNKGNKLQSWTTDGYHPNPRGHDEIAYRMTQVLLPYVQQTADRCDAWSPDSLYRTKLDTLSKGYDGKMCWVHPRAGAIPGAEPTVVLTMQRLLLTGSDVFYALNEVRSDNFGRKWSPLTEHGETLGRRNESDGVIVAACDFTPKWHAKSGKLLGIGHTVRYRNNKVIADRLRETCYSVYDSVKGTWTPWTTLAMPNEAKFENAGAGSVQRVDLPNGDILLPIYFRSRNEKHYRVTVLRCTFDGKSLRYVDHGTELNLSVGRGLYEPSLTRFGSKYYLTMRNDLAAYVSVSDDGRSCSEPRKWEWDQGGEIESYNTQQHWVSHSNALYLVYTRKAVHNDHVFRHRAPLWMAQVDPNRLVVNRKTERILVPALGARLGNFGVVDVNANESWITVAEWMQTWPPEIVIQPGNAYGSDNRVYAARLRWSKPNEAWDKR
jgi:lysophospholipase L1-like esterase